mgnify:CR=1 FL=1
MSDTQERKSTILKGMAGLPSFGDDRKGLAMTTTSSKFFDELAKLMSNAAGAAQGVRKEFDSMVRTQLERAMAGMDVVQREEFEAVKQMAAKAREENERVKVRAKMVDDVFQQATGRRLEGAAEQTPDEVSVSSNAP